MRGPDASNNSLPSKHPVIISIPPVPSPVRGERCNISGEVGRVYADTEAVLYATNKFIIFRNIDQTQALTPSNTLPTFIYRGHSVPVTACAISKSGSYVASGDNKGYFKVWALDHVDHLIKYETIGLSGPIYDIEWDGESKRICYTGERAPTDQTGPCSKALSWDTGNTVGNLGLHIKGRGSTCTFKSTRPYRVVTGGKDDSKLLLHGGPPFNKVPVQDNIPCENAHTKGAVHCVRYNHSGTLLCSVGTDRSIALYEGKTMELKCRIENIHTATVYACAWSANDETILTASGDGTCKLYKVENLRHLKEIQCWKPAEEQYGGTFTKVPSGGAQVGCTFIKNGTKPVSVGFNGQISLLNPTDDTKIEQVITGHYAPIDACTVDYSKNKFYTADTDGILCQWDLDTVQPIERITPSEGNDDLMYIVHTGAASGLALLQNSKLISIGWDDKLFVSIDNKAQPNPISLPAQPSAISTGKNIACIVTVNGLLLYNGKDHTVSTLISIPYEAICVAVSKDDSKVFIGGKDCKIHVYAIENNGTTIKEKHIIENGHVKPIHTISLSNDGTKLASGDEKDICVWNVHTYEALISRGKWCFHTQRITSLAWNMNDTLLASGGADDSIYIWNINNKMKRIHYDFVHRGGIISLHFIKKGLLSIGVDSVVNVLNIDSDVKTKFG